METQIPNDGWQTPVQRFWTAIWFAALSFIPSVLLFRTLTVYRFYECLTLLIIPVLISGCIGFGLSSPKISYRRIYNFIWRSIRFIGYSILVLFLLLFLFVPFCFWLLMITLFLYPVFNTKIFILVITISLAIISIKHFKSQIKRFALAGTCVLVPLGMIILWQTPNLYDVPIYPNAKDVSINQEGGGLDALEIEIKFVSDEPSDKILDYYQQALVAKHWTFDWKRDDGRLYFRDGLNEGVIYLTVEESTPGNFTVVLSLEMGAWRKITSPL